MTRFPTRPDLRIGIVGCGRAATELHGPALSRVPGVTVAALADTDPARLSALARRWPGARCYPDHRALLDDDGVDLVAVCVPAAQHAEVALAALQAERHLFVEKPLALSVDDCDRLVLAAARAEAGGVRAAVGFNLRSHRLVRQARQLVASGTLGDIEVVRTLWTADWSSAPRPSWHTRRADGGGALLEIGTHLADLWRWLLDSEVQSVRALSRSEAFDDQTACLQAKMTNGALVSAAVSQCTASHNVIELFGSRGSLRLSCYHADSLEVTATGARGRGAWRRIRPLLARVARMPAALGAVRGGGDFRTSYANQWKQIAMAVRGAGAVPATLHDGRQAALILAAALRSAEERAEITPRDLSGAGHARTRPA